MINFTKEQIDQMVELYQKGKSLKGIASIFNVSRPTIQKRLNERNIDTSRKRSSSEFVTDPETQIKKCSKCGKELPLICFNKGNSLFGYRSYCRDCEKQYEKDHPERKIKRNERRKEFRKDEEYARKEKERNINKILTDNTSYKKYMLRAARQRARKFNILFNLSVNDFNIPEKCPLLNIPLVKHVGKNTSGNFDSPSLDKIIPEKGYVKGNVWAISNRANMIKNNASLEELKLLVNNLENKINGK